MGEGQTCEAFPKVRRTLAHFTQFSPVWSGSVGADVGVVLDDAGEPDDLDLWVFGFEVLPQVLR